MVRRFAGSPVRRFAGSQVRRFAGSQVRRFAGSLTILVFFHLGALGCESDLDDGPRSEAEDTITTAGVGAPGASRVGASATPQSDEESEVADQPDEVSCVPADAVVPVVMSWAHLADAAGPVEDVPADGVELVVKNQLDIPVSVEVRFVVDTGKQATWKTSPNAASVDAASTVTTTLDLEALDLPIAEMNTSGMAVAIATVTDTETGTRLLGAVSAPLFWHYGTPANLEATAESGTLTVYDESILSGTYQGGDVLGLAPAEAYAGLDDGTPPPIPSRVFIGNDVGIVSQGKTTPQDLVDAGLIEVSEPIIDHPGEER